MAKAGLPGALAGSAAEAALATCQRLCAALGPASPAARSSKVGTPDRAAASASRRETVKSSAGARPQGSMTTAATAAQAAASPPARNTASVSGARTSTSRSGSKPNSARPGPCSGPVSRSPRSSRSQIKGPGRALRSASNRAKPDVAASSPALAAKISCSAASTSPPPSRASRSVMPKLNRVPAHAVVGPGIARDAGNRATRAIRRSRLTCSSYVLFADSAWHESSRAWRRVAVCVAAAPPPVSASTRMDWSPAIPPVLCRLSSRAEMADQRAPTLPSSKSVKNL